MDIDIPSHLPSSSVRLNRLRISLTCYDEIGQGYLREHDIENYIFDQLPSLPGQVGRCEWMYMSVMCCEYHVMR